VVSYTYDFRGNRLTETDASGRIARYEYDALDRVPHSPGPLEVQVMAMTTTRREAAEPIEMFLRGEGGAHDWDAGPSSLSRRASLIRANSGGRLTPPASHWPHPLHSPSSTIGQAGLARMYTPNNRNAE
jgi:YD repeat-containing protein